jgi:DNA-binding SARP family transcriptional activator
VDFRVLGPLEVRVDEGVVPIRAGLPRKLLVALVLRLGERVSIDALADVLWSDEAPGDPVNALQILVSHLRKSFSASGEEVALGRVGKGYRLVARRESVDAYRVEAVAIRARQVGDAASRLGELEAALAEWRGPPIPEVAGEEFAQADLQRLLELRLALMEQRVDALLDLGRHADAALDLQGLIVDHPLRERFYVQLMTALYRSGRQAEALQVYGNARSTLVPVPPLSLPHPDASAVEEIAESAAVQLFTQRAANRDPDFQLDGDNCVDVARVCLLLDGLPLAIELAASHAAALDPHSMVRVLDDRLRLLVDDTRGDRQHALRSTIAWSYDLLRPDEAVFFERLAVFAGPFPLEGAIAVAGDGLQRDGLELLLALTRHSLVAVDGGIRYRLLDTIRAFAVERLETREHEKAAAQRRHASWYADLLAEAAPPAATTASRAGGGNCAVRCRICGGPWSGASPRMRRSLGRGCWRSCGGCGLARASSRTPPDGSGSPRTSSRPAPRCRQRCWQARRRAPFLKAT